LLGCSTKDRVDDIIYIKMLTEGSADSITVYNKGVTLHNFLYYEPQKDSVVYRFIQKADPLQYKTYVGRFENSQYMDTILNLVSFLRDYRNGHLPPPKYDDPMYCGATFYVEFKDQKGIHYKTFITEGDTLSQFSDFFHRLESLPWQRKVVGNNILNEDREIVDVMKGVGTYNEIETPYIPLPCEKGIKLELLYGKWKTIGGQHENANISYWTNSIDKGGSWKIERINKGISKPGYVGNIISIDNDFSIKVKSKHGIAALKILNLTENCLEYRNESNGNIWRLDRMK
jgi:hypothetical protein